MLLSRDLKLIDYADSVTRELLESVDERTVVVVKPALYESLGDITLLLEQSGYTLVDLKSTRLDSADDVERACQLLDVEPEELVHRPEPLVAMSFRGENSIAAVEKLVRTSPFSDLGLSCARSADEAMSMVNFFFRQQLRTTATLEECTCCVIKPHAIKERLVGAILNDITSRGFVVSAAAMFRLERAAAGEFLEVYGM